MMQTIPIFRRHRQRLRDQRRTDGMRSVQIWVPDTRSVEFIAECRRQAHNVASNTTHEHKIMEWTESVIDVDGWEV